MPTSAQGHVATELVAELALALARARGETLTELRHAAALDHRREPVRFADQLAAAAKNNVEESRITSRGASG
eukprot:9833165-Alexandrium_andersonii.AAC.1